MQYSIGQLLQLCKSRLAGKYAENEARAIVHRVFEHYLHLQPAELYIRVNEPVADNNREEIVQAVSELETYRPLQYILGETEFYGLTFSVNENVLIPRPETEELVDWIIKDYKQTGSPFTFIDLGTGSGCIAVCIAHYLVQSKVYAADISEKALEVARKNALLNKAQVDFVNYNMLDTANFPLPAVDCIVSNPPYVMDKEKALMENNVLDYEPHLALFVDDNNPLVFYKAIAGIASEYLAPGGNVYLEINEQLPEQTASLFPQHEFSVEIRNDINDKPRMVKATKKVNR